MLSISDSNFLIINDDVMINESFDSTLEALGFISFHHYSNGKFLPAGEVIFVFLSVRA